MGAASEIIFTNYGEIMILYDINNLGMNSNILQFISHPKIIGT